MEGRLEDIRLAQLEKDRLTLNERQRRCFRLVEEFLKDAMPVDGPEFGGKPSDAQKKLIELYALLKSISEEGLRVTKGG